MISKEEINNAAIAYGKRISKDNIHSEAAGYDFAQGAKWASRYSNFNWVDVKEDLPCNHKELVLYDSTTKLVLTVDHEGCILPLRMNKSCNGIIGIEPWWQWQVPAVIEYWMPIPELPKD